MGVLIHCRSKKSKRKLSQKVLIESNETTDSTDPQNGEGVKPKSTRKLHIYLVFVWYEYELFIFELDRTHSTTAHTKVVH